MSTLDAQQRRALPGRDFAGPGRSYPVPDAAHARLAKAMASRYASPGERQAIDARANAVRAGPMSGDINSGGVAVIPATLAAFAFSSGDVANTAGQTVVVPAVAGKTIFVTGFSVTGLGATAAANVLVTLSNISNGQGAAVATAPTWELAIPAGATTAFTPLMPVFEPPLAVYAPNTNMTLTIGSFGAGAAHMAATVTGFYA